MSKRDRQGVRTAPDLERKYNLGQMNTDRGLLMQQKEEISQMTEAINQYMASTNGDIADLKEKADSANEAIYTISQSVDALDGRVNDVGNNLGKLEKNVDEEISVVNKEVDNINKEIENINKDIDEIDEVIRNLGGDSEETEEDNYYFNKVPISDIFKVFQSYWNAEYVNADGTTIKDPLIYSSINADSYELNANGSVNTGAKVTGGGRRNGMWFGDGNRVPRYAFNTSGTKVGQPINCSTLASLVMLGIPYADSKYSKALSSYDISQMYSEGADIKNSFSLYGDAPVGADNHEAFFITRRMLSRFSELGLEIPSLHDDWKQKTSSTTWYDCIAPSSDLREAKPGDIVFWNTDSVETDDPRRVSHCLLVVSRLSYDSTNPKQPLLVMVEATTGSSIGVQPFYYMQTGNEKNIPKFICRPNYRRLVGYPYVGISPMKLGSDFQSYKYDINGTLINNSTTDAKKVTIKHEVEGRRLYTVYLDWTPQASTSFLSIRLGEEERNEVLRHYIPNTMGGNKYRRVKIVVPLRAYVSTTEANEIKEMRNHITIMEAKEVDGTYQTLDKIVIDNIEVYDGIPSEDKTPTSLTFNFTEEQLAAMKGKDGKDGSDAEVTQANIVNALGYTPAPNGYGLGTNGKSIDSVTNITASGWYLTNGDTPDGKWWYCEARASGGGTGVVVDAWKVGSTRRALRYKTNSSWSEWEWVNPLMDAGVEYRTADFYEGKNVFVKLIDFGTLPNKTSKTVATGINGSNVIDMQINFHMSSGTFTLFPYVNTSYAVKSRCTLDSSGNLVISSNIDMSDYTAKVTVKYTKP